MTRRGLGSRLVGFFLMPWILALGAPGARAASLTVDLLPQGLCSRCAIVIPANLPPGGTTGVVKVVIHNPATILREGGTGTIRIVRTPSVRVSVTHPDASGDSSLDVASGDAPQVLLFDAAWLFSGGTVTITNLSPTDIAHVFVSIE